MAFQCDTHPEVQASVLVTNLDNGDVVALCGMVCLPEWAAAMDAALNADPDQPVAAQPHDGTMAAADQLDGGVTVGGDDAGRTDNGAGAPITPEQAESEDVGGVPAT